MKSARILPLAAAAFIGMLTIASAQEKRIIVVSHGQANDPFWSVVKNGVTAAAAVNQNPAGLIVSIPDASALSAPIMKTVAAKKKIHHRWDPIQYEFGLRSRQGPRRAAPSRPGRK